MDATARLAAYLHTHKLTIGKVVDFDAEKDRLLPLDFTSANTELTAGIIDDTEAFSHWVDEKLRINNCRYGIGGYMENRTVYARSTHFNADGEPRRLHLGIDIWGAAGTPVYAPLPAIIHSFNNNNNFGDYGPTVILAHQLSGLPLFSLYGHLSKESLNGLSVGQAISINQQIGVFGHNTENGCWPPHLHFQLMLDMEGCVGDYPGVAQVSKKEYYLQNIPDPNLLLRLQV